MTDAHRQIHGHIPYRRIRVATFLLAVTSGPVIPPARAQRASPDAPAAASVVSNGPAAAAAWTTEVARADRLLATGDVSGARRWYEYAAVRGSAVAATSLGKTYDPGLLGKWHVLGGVRAEPDTARLWYQKGEAMGDPTAAAWLAALNAGR